MTEAFAACLEKIRVDAPSMVVDHSAKAFEIYSRDESTSSQGFIYAVLFPTTVEEVSIILRHAQEHRIPVVPRGAGSGLSGACVPEVLSFIVSLEKMNRILEIDTQNHQAVVEPGVITGYLRHEAELKGLFYPPIPSSLDYCTLGGNVATNAGGLCAVKYGVTRKYVLGLEAVLPGGDIIRTGGKFVKHTSGYDFTQLLTGSEGTLAIITKITFSLLPFPSERATILVAFESLRNAGQCIAELLSKGIVPPTLELMPREAIDCVLNINRDLSFPFSQESATLLIEMDAFTPTSLQGEVEKLYEIVTTHTNIEPLLAASSSQRDEFWSVRKKIREAIAREANFVEADAVVPRKSLPALIEAAQLSAQEFGLKAVSYGHAGDGNLHTYFQNTNHDETGWQDLQPKVLKHFFDQVVKLEGTISGEHGIGSLKKKYLPLAISERQIDLMRQVKKAFDPYGILNPGKVLP